MSTEMIFYPWVAPDKQINEFYFVLIEYFYFVLIECWFLVLL
jgi:hypothetical protein